MEGCITPGSPGNRTPGCTGRASTQGRLRDISAAQVKNVPILTASNRQRLWPWAGLQPLGTAGRPPPVLPRHCGSSWSLHVPRGNLGMA